MPALRFLSDCARACGFTHRPPVLPEVRHHGHARSMQLNSALSSCVCTAPRSEYGRVIGAAEGNKEMADRNNGFGAYDVPFLGPTRTGTKGRSEDGESAEVGCVPNTSLSRRQKDLQHLWQSALLLQRTAAACCNVLRSCPRAPYRLQVQSGCPKGAAVAHRQPKWRSQKARVRMSQRFSTWRTPALTSQPRTRCLPALHSLTRLISWSLGLMTRSSRLLGEGKCFAHPSHMILTCL